VIWRSSNEVLCLQLGIVIVKLCACKVLCFIFAIVVVKLCVCDL
jgi:hypothetical protein